MDDPVDDPVDDLVPGPPARLYTPADLLGGFAADDPRSYARTLDGRAYLAWVRQGGRTAPDGVATRRAAHDTRVTSLLNAALVGRRAVAIMGGHRTRRCDDAYRHVATIAWRLTAEGFTVVTGGGPGAMEAAHLGARLGRSPAADLRHALDDMTAEGVPQDFPLERADDLVAGGGYAAGTLAALHAWQRPAFDLAARTGARGAESIGIPTWLYGHEPPTPLATHHAKYFENSIREDGLLAVALYGVVFAPGGAGTLQEIYQDAAQNRYASVRGLFSPMVFLDLDGIWRTRYAVDTALYQLFGPEHHRMLAFVDDAGAAVDAVVRHRDEVDRHLAGDTG
ncbi:MAG TPA: hypothetical protein VF743_07705 [Acidimicrobiales bacterium]